MYMCIVKIKIILFYMISEILVSIYVFLSICRCVQRNGVFRQAMMTAQRHGGQTAQNQDEKPSGSDLEDDKPLDVVGSGDPDSPISAHHHHHHHHQSHQPGKFRRQVNYVIFSDIISLSGWIHLSVIVDWLHHPRYFNHL